MYKVKLQLTGDEWSLDHPLKILEEYPLMMLRDIQTGEIIDSSNIKESSLTLELVYDPVKLKDLKKISDKNQAFILINSELWRGNCQYFSDDLMNDKELVIEIIKYKRWNGNCEYFSKNLMNDEDVKDHILSYRNYIDDIEHEAAMDFLTGYW